MLCLDRTQCLVRDDLRPAPVEASSNPPKTCEIIVDGSYFHEQTLRGGSLDVRQEDCLLVTLWDYGTANGGARFQLR